MYQFPNIYLYMENTLSTIENRLGSLKVFHHNKVSILTKVVSALITNAGLSIRKTSRIASIAFKKVSHVSVRRYHKALRKVLYGVKPKRRETIAVGETKLKVNGRLVFVGLYNLEKGF